VELLEGRALLSLSPISASGAKFPFTTIGQLSITFPDGKKFFGTGTMIDRFHVLTAGHNVYSYSDGGWASSIKFTPLLDGSYAPYGSAYMTYERTYNSFISYVKSHPHATATNINDIGLITLDRTLGDRTGWMSYGYDNNNSRFAPGTIFNTAGYPAAGGYSGYKMYFSSGKIAGLSSDLRAINYYQSQITTYGGQSGSAVYLYKSSDGSRTIYGIHVGGSGAATSKNFATRITQSIYTDIGRWRGQDAAPARRAVAVASATQVQHAAMPDSSVGAVVLQATAQGLIDVTPKARA
jgi:V8-like Glu-specific endopeptidase